MGSTGTTLLHIVYRLLILSFNYSSETSRTWESAIFVGFRLLLRYGVSNVSARILYEEGDFYPGSIMGNDFENIERNILIDHIQIEYILDKFKHLVLTKYLNRVKQLS